LSRSENTSDVVTVDREGSVVGTYHGIAYARDPAVSPDGSRLAFWGVSVHDGERVFDITPERGVGPTWSPDGREIIFEVDNTLWRVDSDGTSEPELVTEDGGDTPHWSSDGKYVAFAAWEELEGEFSEREIALRWTVQTDIVVLPLKGGEPRVFRGSEHSEFNPRFSPDGTFLAYASDRSGQMEIYVATFPEGDRRWKVSDDGGRFPRWSRPGDEIYYASREVLMAAAFDRNGDEVDLGSPIRLFSTLETAVDLSHFGSATYDVTPEGQFVALRAFVYGDDRAAVLVQNWPAMLVPER
jgi:Tol biopolymer transport system component